MNIPFLPGFPLLLAITPLSIVFSIMVAIVAAFILFYSLGYMQKEPGKIRFYFFMLLFTAGMQAFIFSGDWLLLLMAWELIAVSSYFLIGFYREKPQAASAATRAFLTTRSADTGLMIGILLLTAVTGTTALSQTLKATEPVATIATLFISIAAIAKAAQVPFDGWLRDAMAGPTPVSALLHSATLVAAGVMLLIKITPLFSPTALLLIGLIGGATALITGMAALAQKDLKRLLAASTSSQLGLMLLAIASGSAPAAALHLIANAAMKSSLFLGAGVFQHKREGTAFSLLRGVGKNERFVFLIFAIAGLALSGIPPLAGFWSKDAIIAATLTSPFASFFVPFALIASVFTGAYISRTIRLLWQGSGQDEELSGGKFMYISMAGLIFFVLLFYVFLTPLEEILGLPVVEGLIPALLGLIVASFGLGAGWIYRENVLPRSFLERAGNGFTISSGLDKVVIQATFALARELNKYETAFIDFPTTVGQSALNISEKCLGSESAFLSLVHSTGRMNLLVGIFSKERIEIFLDGIIATLSAGVKDMGMWGRRLQSGLIHQEMAYAMYATILLLILYVSFVMIGK